MRIARVAHGGAIAFGVIEGPSVAILDGPPIGDLRFSGERVPFGDARLLAPVLPSKIVCISNSYPGQKGNGEPAEPQFFLKPSTAVIGPGETIRTPAGVQRLEHEGELAVVVQGLVRNADEETAARSILGYTCANDLTARDLQERDANRWGRAKAFDTFCPLGPWIETDPDWESSVLEVRVNGEVRQHAAVKEMGFSPAFLVSWVSRIMTLLPGDVILTGTPPGSSAILPGDSCDVEISGIGELQNSVA